MPGGWIFLRPFQLMLKRPQFTGNISARARSVQDRVEVMISLRRQHWLSLLASLLVGCAGSQASVQGVGPPERSRSAPEAARGPPEGWRPTPAVMRPEMVQAPRSARFERYEYFFDRNALSTSVEVGDSLVAITEAGHLLRFDKKSFALTGEVVCSRVATALGRAHGSRVLVGYASGRIADLDATTLEQRTVDSVLGIPVWIGERPDGAVVVVHGRRAADRRTPRAVFAFRVRDVSSQREAPIGPATAFLLDSAGRLWMGGDWGEWGGDLFRLDWSTGREERLGGRNVYGFAEPAPGEVWALGGVIHFKVLESFVERLAPSRALLFEGGAAPVERAAYERWLASERPHAPVTDVASLPSGKLWLFSYGEIWEGDLSLHTFRKAATLKLSYDPGRPDAVASYPAVRTVHASENAVTFATGRDGYQTLEDGRQISHALPNQLGTPAWDVLVAGDELIVVEEGAAWRRSNSGWNRTRLPAPEGYEPVKPPLNAEETRVAALVEQHSQTARAKRWTGHLPRAGAIYDRADWDSRHFVIATDRGLCLIKKSDSDRCRFIDLPEVDDKVTHLLRDEQGRLWLAGRGLWFVDSRGRALSAASGLPFLNDTELASLTVAGSKLVLGLGRRGLALLDLASLKIPAPGATPKVVSRWDLAQPHEPKPSDGAVFVTIEPGAGGQWRYELARRLQLAVERSSIYAYSGQATIDAYDFADTAYYSPNPSALVRVLLKALAHEPRASDVTLHLRNGPLGTALVKIR